METYLRDIRDSVAVMTAAHQKRNDSMRAARDAGATWRAIALAADMTEHGVRYALAAAAAYDDDATATYQESVRAARAELAAARTGS